MMKPEVKLAERLYKFFCLRLVSREQRILIKAYSGSLKSYLRVKIFDLFDAEKVASLRRI